MNIKTGKRKAAIALAVCVLLLSMPFTVTGKEQEPVEEKEGKVILDDAGAEIRLTEIYEIAADKKDTETEEPKAGISFVIKNKGDKEIILDLRDLKAGDQSVRRLLLKGDIVAPGETQEFRYGLMPEKPEDRKKEAEAEITLAMLEEQGIRGTVRVLDGKGEVAKADFSTKE